jgi:hypothetical protein
MTKQKAIATTAFGMILVFTVHFFSTVYVSRDLQQREVMQTALVIPDTVLPYNADKLKQLFKQWALPQQAVAKVAEAVDNPLAEYDNTQLGDTRIALLAIYQLQQHTAVLALQATGQPLYYVRMAAGENIGDIQLNRITQRDVTITRGAQQVTLRLFKPVSASSEE